MPSEPRRLVIVVRPGARTQSILAWLRQLVPAALLVIAGANLPAPDPTDDAVVLDDDDVASGPLSLADALARRLAAHGPAQVTTTSKGPGRG